MDLDLSGKRAIVCGSTKGIGRAVAVELASLGADVTLLARNEERLRAVLKELPSQHGQRHEYLVADFSEPETLRKHHGSRFALEPKSVPRAARLKSPMSLFILQSRAKVP